MSSPAPDQRLEAEVKAMLQRRALDVDPEAPPWRELAQRQGAVVISLRTGTPLDADEARKRPGPGRQWFRPVLAAAIALALVMAAAVLVGGGRGSRDDDLAEGPIPVPAAGNRDFAPVDAVPFFPAAKSDEPLPVDDWITDPTLTARTYLTQVGLPVDDVSRFRLDIATEAMAARSGVGADEEAVQTATAAWSVRPAGQPEARPITTGVVFLRNTEQGARDTWLVVGVMTANLRLDDIERGEDSLTFVVDRSADDSGITSPARVLVDGVVVEEVGVGESRTIQVRKPADAEVLVQVEHVEDGKVMSITATAVASIPVLTGVVSEPPAIVLPTDLDPATDLPLPTVEAQPGVSDGAVEVEKDGRRSVVVGSRSG